jgi:hypothetical protein
MEKIEEENFEENIYKESIETYKNFKNQCQEMRNKIMEIKKNVKNKEKMQNIKEEGLYILYSIKKEEE